MKQLIIISIICFFTNLNGMGCLPQSCIDTALDKQSYMLLRFFLFIGADPNESHPEGLTPLHRAVTMEDPRFAHELLKAGARVAARTRHGWQPIHYASAHNKPIAISLLALYGADTNAPTNPQTQTTPLHLAAYRQHKDAVQALLQVGANPLRTNIHKQTALHQICIPEKETSPEYHSTIANLLIEHASRHECHRDTYLALPDKKGRAAKDYISDDTQEEELCKALRTQLQIDTDNFYAMLKKRKMSVPQFLLARQLGQIRYP